MDGRRERLDQRRAGTRRSRSSYGAAVSCNSSSRRRRNKTLRSCAVGLFQGVFCLVYLTLLLLSGISLGYFTKTHLDIYFNANDSFSGDFRCVLEFTDKLELDEDSELELGPNQFCWGALAGEGAVCVITVLFLLSSVLKALFGKSGISPLLILEIFIIGITFIISLSVFILLFFGLKQTCSLIDCAAGIGGKDGGTIYFKDSIDTAKASRDVDVLSLYPVLQWVTAGLGAGMLLVILLIEILLIIVYFAEMMMRSNSEHHQPLIRAESPGHRHRHLTNHN